MRLASGGSHFEFWLVDLGCFILLGGVLVGMARLSKSILAAADLCMKHHFTSSWIVLLTIRQHVGDQMQKFYTNAANAFLTLAGKAFFPPSSPLLAPSGGSVPSGK